jgi:hypothetical protein
VQTETLVGDARDTPTSRGIILPPIFTTLRGRFAASIAIVLKSDLVNTGRLEEIGRISPLPLGEYHQKITIYGFAIFWLHLNLLVAEPS